MTATVAGGTRLAPHQRKALVAGAVGNTVEWVDWAVYATFAPIFAAQFFAPGDPTAALLSTMGVFAVGFVMRPIGGAVLGAYADRHGRKKGLTLTIGLMSGASAVIAVAPTYDSVGLLAPLILLLARLVQGFSAGGEFGSSSSFMVESAAPRRRAFAGSWQQVSVGAGTLIAAGMGTVLTTVLDESALASWGWRVAFGVGALLGLIGLWLRVSVSETEAFAALTERAAEQAAPRRNAFVVMVRDHPRAALRVVGITIAGTLIYYIWVSFMPTYAHIATGIPLRDALLANTIALVAFLVLLPFGGILSDRVGRKPTMLAFAGGFVLFAWPAFHFLGDSFWGLLTIELIGMVLIVGYSANCAVVMAEQFPAEVRSTGIGLPYALAVALFGGTAPYVTTWLTTHEHGDLVWLYVAVAALIGVAVYATMPETKGRALS
ncbi:MFS transporter, MHS family, alpha-ketoglutarate permease [Pseudonocardia ammonioxydans]|uniref:Putative proline/betaine transporter n=1 Tax=Pseudonocardia ammonioxydans TaxID=260086 RepID=A0A1I5AN45_PSUAM|nr:MFS transporter [Pseudonocardia ammonioxydans]SFN63956.1 MFS transporter, MHS family, alpha-ketoglutarate permease [Pseudonocardia ammonioxydans]